MKLSDADDRSAAASGQEPPVPAVAGGRRRFRRAQGRPFWQASVFTVANGLVSVLGVVSSAILARHLSTSVFGTYALMLSLLQLSSIVFDFGLGPSAARLAALQDTSGRRQIVGAEVLLYLPVGLAYCVTIVVLSFGVDDWFNVDAGSALRLAAPLAIAIPASQLVQRVSQGVDRLHVASLTSLGLQLLFVVLLAAAVSVDHSLSLSLALVIRCVSVLVSVVAAVIWLRPLFSEARSRIREILSHTREYGFHVYVGHLFSIGTYNMDVLMIGALADSRSVGFYSLAGAIAAAAGLPVLGMSSALFARMARAPKIHRQWLVLALVIGGCSALAASLLAGPFIHLVYSDRYAPAAGLVFPLALAQLVRGVTAIYNTFLSSHGYGRQLRNAGFALAGSNVVFNFALISPFGATGAAWASLAALGVNLIAHVVSYRSSLRAEVNAHAT